MIRLLFRSPLSLLGAGVLLYIFFFVPLGELTAFQHARRIAGTEEARELGQEAGAAARRLEKHLQSEVGRLLDAGVDGGGDAGSRAAQPPQ